MRRHVRPDGIPVAILLIALVLASACATSEALRRAEEESERGNWDAAVAYYRQAVEEDPENVEYQIELERALFQASQQHERIARDLRVAGDLEQALQEYQLSVQLDPGNQVAVSGLRSVQQELAEAGGDPPPLTRLEELKQRARELQPTLPELQPQVDESFSLDLRDAEIRDVYRTLARVAGLSVLFDAQFQDRVTSIELADVTFFEALDFVTRSQGHFYKPLSDSVFVVAPDNPNIRRAYNAQVMRTFYLSNAGSEAVAQRLQQLLEIQFVVQDPELNTVTVRAPPEVVALAERIVDATDKSPGEVMLEIEILEVNRRLLREYGISLSQYDVTQSLAQGDGGISVNDLRFINASDWFVTLPSIRYRLFKESGDFKLVADPHVRLTEGEEASLVIGEEVPIVTTTFNPTQLSGNQVVPIRSTQFRDVGIVLGVGARVHHNNEVTLDLEIEVSSIAGTSTVENLPIFATRRVGSVLRLGDGETNVLAGLLRDDERTSLTGVPGLSDLPLLGEIFAENMDEVTQTDVILSITPHILRAPDITLDDLASSYVGTGAVISGPGQPQAAPDAGPEPGQSPAEAADTIGADPPAAGRGDPGGSGPPSADAPDLEHQVGQPASVSLAPASFTVQTGDEFAVEIRADDARQLFAADLQLGFDPAVLEYSAAEEGVLLTRDGAQVAFRARPSGESGVGVGISRMGTSSGVSGSGALVTVYFRAIAPGSTSIEIDSGTLRTPEGDPSPAELAGAAVEVRPAGLEERPDGRQ